jgi:hypothetical protein
VAAAIRAACLILAGGLALAASGAWAQNNRPAGVRRYQRLGVRFDHVASWSVREQSTADSELVVLRVAPRGDSPAYARLSFLRRAGNASGNALRLPDVVEHFRRERLLKSGPARGGNLAFDEKQVFRRLLGGPTPGRQLRYSGPGAPQVAETYVAHRGRRAFALELVHPQSDSAAAAALAVIADSFQADEVAPSSPTSIDREARRSYVGHGIAFQYPAGWALAETEDDGSITLVVSEGPATQLHMRLVLIRGDHIPRLLDAVAELRSEVQLRAGPTKVEVRSTARALNGERVDGALATYVTRGTNQTAEVFVVQVGRRAVVVTLGGATHERPLGAPAFDLLAESLLVGAWPRVASP